MILYKNPSNGYWRIPQEIRRKSGSSITSDPTYIYWNNGGAWNIKYGQNAPPTTGSDALPQPHPFWFYSLNPTFNANEGNYFNDINEYCFSTESSNPSSHGRYAAGIGACTIYLRQGQSDGLSDCLIKPKFELNVIANGTARYRTKVTVSSRNPTHPSGRFFRLTINAIRGGGGDSYVQLSEFSMLGLNGAELNGTYTNVNGSSPGTEGPTNLGDENTSTKWLNFTGTGSIVQIDMGSTVNVFGYRLATANDANHRDPVSWTLESSNNGATWTTIASVSNFGTPTARFTYFTADQFSLVPTILSGFWFNTYSGGANLIPGQSKPSGLGTSWGPPANFSRTTNITTSGQPQTTWDATTKVYTWDVTLAAGNTFLRPIIKIENKSFLGTEQSITISDWLVSRTA
jgi:hypothetical protein